MFYGYLAKYLSAGSALRNYSKLSLQFFIAIAPLVTRAELIPTIWNRHVHLLAFLETFLARLWTELPFWCFTSAMTNPSSKTFMESKYLMGGSGLAMPLGFLSSMSDADLNMRWAVCSSAYKGYRKKKKKRMSLSIFPIAFVIVRFLLSILVLTQSMMKFSFLSRRAWNSTNQVF